MYITQLKNYQYSYLRDSHFPFGNLQLEALATGHVVPLASRLRPCVQPGDEHDSDQMAESGCYQDRLTHPLTSGGVT